MNVVGERTHDFDEKKGGNRMARKGSIGDEEEVLVIIHH